MFKTIKENVSAEIVEKKSKFIANIFYVESKEESEKIIKDINKKYHDARHNCYAYRITEENEVIEKSSDDGEPSGTAGAPMLNILSKNNLSNILVIVTRYFGGILLGTGGLVRAYSAACNKALDMAEIIDMDIYELYEIEMSYEDVKKFKYFAQNNNITIKNEEYSDVIKIQIAIKNEKILDNLRQKEINVKRVRFIKKIYA